MLIVLPSEMKKIDEKAIKEFGIDGRILMENAGRGVIDVLLKKDFDISKVCVLCGKGSNGGDGFVIARYLSDLGSDINVYIFGDQNEIKGDALYHFELLEMKKIKIKELNPNDPELRFDLLTSDVIIDAIFGTGFKGELPKELKIVLPLLNDRRGKLVAVDIPSGVNGETGECDPATPFSDLTVTFAYPKLGHVLYPGREKAGEIYLVNIGIPKRYGDEIKRRMIFPYDVYPFLPKRDKKAHKGKCGRVLIIGGAKGYGGAVYLAGMGAYLGGAGLVYIAFPEDLYCPMETKITEAIKIPLPSQKGRLYPKSLFPLNEILDKIDVIAFGPGILRDEDTKSFVLNLMDKVKEKKVLIDADGVVLLSDDKDIFKKREESTIITPHPGEMAMFLGDKKPDEVDKDRVFIAEKVSYDYDLIVVLKGAPTVISSMYGTFICPLGNPGMATGGSGDVLTGLISGLWAQGLPPERAARLGVFLHALAGDLAQKEKGIYSLIATDILDKLPLAFNFKFEIKKEGLIQKLLPLI